MMMIWNPNLLAHRCCVPTKCRERVAQSPRCPESSRPWVRPWRPGMHLRADRRMVKKRPFECRVTSSCWRWAVSRPLERLRSARASVWLREGRSAGCRTKVLRRGWCPGERTGWETGWPRPRWATATTSTAPERTTEVCRTEPRENNSPASNPSGLKIWLIS